MAGTWYGLVYRRWSLTGLWIFIACQVAVCLVAALTVTWVHAWHSVGHFFATLSAAGLTGVLAVILVILAVGGSATMRRVTV